MEKDPAVIENQEMEEVANYWSKLVKEIPDHQRTVCDLRMSRKHAAKEMAEDCQLAVFEKQENEKIANYWTKVVEEIPNHQGTVFDLHMSRKNAAKQRAEACQLAIIAKGGFIVIDPSVPRAEHLFDHCLPCGALDPACLCQSCTISPYFDNSNIETARALSRHFRGVAAFRQVLGSISEDKRYMFLVSACCLLKELGVSVEKRSDPLVPSDSQIDAIGVSPSQPDLSVGGQPGMMNCGIRRGRGL